MDNKVDALWRSASPGDRINEVMHEPHTVRPHWVALAVDEVADDGVVKIIGVAAGCKVAVALLGGGRLRRHCARARQ